MGTLNFYIMELNEDKLVIEIGDTLECIKEVPDDLKNTHKGELFIITKIFIDIKNNNPIEYVTIQNEHKIHTWAIKELPEFFVLHNKYIHLKTGNPYKYIKPIRVKHPDTGEWFDGVLYQSLKTREEFVRSKESFDSHFKEV